MRIGVGEVGIMGMGIIGIIFQVVLALAQLYALYLFIKAAKIYISNNEEFDDKVQGNPGPDSNL